MIIFWEIGNILRNKLSFENSLCLGNCVEGSLRGYAYNSNSSKSDCSLDNFRQVKRNTKKGKIVGKFKEANSPWSDLIKIFCEIWNSRDKY